MRQYCCDKNDNGSCCQVAESRFTLEILATSTTTSATTTVSSKATTTSRITPSSSSKASDLNLPLGSATVVGPLFRVIKSTMTSRPPSSSSKASKASDTDQTSGSATTAGSFITVSAPEPSSTTSFGAGKKIGVGVGSAFGLFAVIGLALLWFRQRRNNRQRKVEVDGIELEPDGNPSFEEEIAKSPCVQSGADPSEDSWPVMRAGFSTHPRFSRAVSPVEYSHEPLSPIPVNSPPSPDQTLPPDSRQRPPSPPMAKAQFHQLVSMVPKQEPKQAFPSPAPQPPKLAPEMTPGSIKSYLRDHPQPLQSNGPTSIFARPASIDSSIIHQDLTSNKMSRRKSKTPARKSIPNGSDTNIINDSADVQNFSRKLARV